MTYETLTHDELAETLRNCASRCGPCTNCKMKEDLSCTDTLMAQAADVIDNLREERKTGRWVKAHGWCTPGGDPVWMCSECGKGMHFYGIEHGSYGSDIADHQWVACPNCGALMED